MTHERGRSSAQDVCSEHDHPSRRDFLGIATSCSAHLFLTLAAGTPLARRAFASAPRVQPLVQESWGRLERVAEGAWALVSTPLAEGLDARRTLCNGGIIAGRDGVVVVEGFASQVGARWLAEAAQELTGRWPTHVVLTHYHGDHSNGLPAYLAGGRPATFVTTGPTLERLAELGQDRETAAAATQALDAPGNVRVGDTAHELDLGGREVRVVPRSGHTRSDLSVELVDPRVVWCGDLVWNGMFPNYVDATPSRKSEHVRSFLAEPRGIFVPGHGSLADAAELEDYLDLLDHVEAAARAAYAAGAPVDQAAADYRPPGALGEWTLFSDRYYRVAFGAWERELGGGS